MLGWLIHEIERENRQGGGGGGGKLRIRFGKTGPRGRIYSPTPKGTTVIAKSKYIRAGKGARVAIREHLRYIQERERGEGEPERKFFDRDRNEIERDEVFEKMLENRGLRTAMHTLILSPGENALDIQDYTRESMKALEERLGHDLDWYATIHRNTEHHHAHVVIPGKIPGHERELERRQAREWELDYQRTVEREFSWTNKEAQLRELLGPRYDERAATDPREDRRAERSRWGDSTDREPIDPKVRDLIDDNPRSPAELKFERLLDRYEHEMARRESAKDRGDVFLDRNDLKELRSAGNDYVHRERSLERSFEHAYEREFGRQPELERTREIDLERSEWSEISRTFESDRQLGEIQHSFEPERSREEDEREHQMGRDDFDRGK